MKLKELLNNLVKNKILFIFTGFAILLFFYTGYEFRGVITNQDGLSYIAIAQHYLKGNFDIAINAYWSPFVSWLMIPFIALGLGGATSLMIVNIIAATVILLTGIFIIKKYSKGNIVPIFYTVTILPFLMSAISQATPDLWLAAWVLIFTLMLKSVGAKLRSGAPRAYIHAGILLGLVGAIGYFIKLYALPVFLATMLFYSLLVFYSSKKKKSDNKVLRKNVLTLFFVSMASFLILSAPWLFALGNKYHEFMFGSSFAQNINIVKKQPVFDKENHLTPIFPQDPTYEKKEGQQYSKSEFLKHRIPAILKTFPFYINTINAVSPFILISALFVGAAILFGKIKYRLPFDKTILIASLVFFVYFMGYLAILGNSPGAGNTRYYWPLLPLSVLVISLFLPVLWRDIKKERLINRYAFILIILLLPFSTYTQYAFGLGYIYSLPISKAGIASKTRKGDTLFKFKKDPRQLLAEEISSRHVIEPDKKIASNNTRGLIYIAYTTKTTAYSIPDLTSDNLLDKLKDARIDYYVYFSPDKASSLFGKSITVYQTTSEKYRCDYKKRSAYEKCYIDIVKLR